MTDELVEKMKRAALKAEFSGSSVGAILSVEVVDVIARACLSAIEAEGMVIVPRAAITAWADSTEMKGFDPVLLAKIMRLTAGIPYSDLAVAPKQG